MTNSVGTMTPMPFVRLDFWWWIAIWILISAALNWPVILLVIVLLLTLPLVHRFTPLKAKS